MTELLKKAFEAASKFPPETQDAIAARLLLELEDEARWDSAFAGSQDQLAAMASEALTEHKAGLARPMDDVL
jgi:hypothetical protein